ncbi:Protein C29E4.12 [Aphelenchoides avenae]|nr:Protein C29E4.12 [Aphelenchus avenae]
MGGPIGSVQFDYTGPPVTVSNNMALDLVGQFGMQNAWHAYLKLRGLNLTKDEAEKVLSIKRFRNKVRRLKQTINTLKGRSDDASTFLSKEFTIAFEDAQQNNNDKEESSADGSETDGSVEEPAAQEKDEKKADDEPKEADSDDDLVPALRIADAPDESVTKGAKESVTQAEAQPTEATKAQPKSGNSTDEADKPVAASKATKPTTTPSSSQKKKTSEEAIDDAVSSVLMKIKNNEPFGSEYEGTSTKDVGTPQKQPKKMFRNLNRSAESKADTNVAASSAAAVTSPIGIAITAGSSGGKTSSPASTKPAKERAQTAPKAAKTPSTHLSVSTPKARKKPSAIGNPAAAMPSSSVTSETRLNMPGSASAITAPMLSTHFGAHRLPAVPKIITSVPNMNQSALAAFAPFAMPVPNILASFPGLYAAQQGAVLGDSATVATLLRNLHVQQQLQQPSVQMTPQSTVTVTEIPSPKPSPKGVESIKVEKKSPDSKKASSKKTPEKKEVIINQDNQVPGPSESKDTVTDEPKKNDAKVDSTPKKSKSATQPKTSPSIKKQTASSAQPGAKQIEEQAQTISDLEDQVAKLKKQLQTEKTKTNAQRRRADQLQEELQRKMDAVQVAQVDLICQQKDSEKLLQELDNLKSENKKLRATLNDTTDESPKSSGRSTRKTRDSSTSSKAVQSKTSPSQGVSTRKRAAAEAKQEEPETEEEPEPEPEGRRQSKRICAARSKFLCSTYSILLIMERSRTAIPTLRRIMNELRKTKGSLASDSQEARYLMQQMRQHQMTQKILCKSPNEMEHIADTYATYLNSTRQLAELHSRYARGEKTVEESARLVGLQIPSKSG